MRSLGLISAFATLLMASHAIAQNQRAQQPQPAAKPGPYKVVPVTPPQAIIRTLEAFRKQMSEAAQRKDRGALAKLVVGQGFFWLTRER